MNPTIEVNKRVQVITTFNTKDDVGKSCVPYKMMYGDKEVTFTEVALRFPTIQGKRMIHVFNMNDGINGYRLELDAERLQWTVVSMIPGLAR